MDTIFYPNEYQYSPMQYFRKLLGYKLPPKPNLHTKWRTGDVISFSRGMKYCSLRTFLNNASLFCIEAELAYFNPDTLNAAIRIKHENDEDWAITVMHKHGDNFDEFNRVIRAILHKQNKRYSFKRIYGWANTSLEQRLRDEQFERVLDVVQSSSENKMQSILDEIRFHEEKIKALQQLNLEDGNLEIRL